jgi:DNA-binding beta-propeller fold protein YncE
MVKLIKISFLLSLMFSAENGLSQMAKFPPLPYKASLNPLRIPVGINLEETPGIAINSHGHIFLFHRGARQLMEFDAEGEFIRSIADGLFTRPHGLRIDREDNLWITDIGSQVVLKLSQAGRVLLVLGRKDKAGETELLFDRPTDIAFGPDDAIYVSDGYGNSRIVKYDKDGNFVKAWGTKGAAPGQFSLPHAIVADSSGKLYVADRDNKRIQIFDANGNFLKDWTHVGAPWGLCIEKNKFIYMADGFNNRLLKLDMEGNVLGEFGTPGRKVGQFNFAHGVAVTARGEILVTEILNWRVQKLEALSK